LTRKSYIGDFKDANENDRRETRDSGDTRPPRCSRGS